MRYYAGPGADDVVVAAKVAKAVLLAGDEVGHNLGGVAAHERRNGPHRSDESKKADRVDPPG
ncbi:MAG: hypothetical protein COA41_00525 [Sphingopyxis sp.]|nr:MAG: hypothetical protein COA41_00525 [Sphingopyxis sp.]